MCTIQMHAVCEEKVAAKKQEVTTTRRKGHTFNNDQSTKEVKAKSRQRLLTLPLDPLQTPVSQFRECHFSNFKGYSHLILNRK